MIYLTEEEHAELREKAFNKNISMSGLVKHLLKFGNSVESQVTEYKKETPKFKIKPDKPIDKLKAEVAEKVLHDTLYPETTKNLENSYYPQPKKGKNK